MFTPGEPHTVAESRHAWICENAPDLNYFQRDAVISVSPDIVCIAGAGSGKTRTLVARIRCLIETGADPANIVAITFTNKAAEEIQSRLGDNKLRYLGTLHGYCLSLLRAHGSHLGYGPEIAILDQRESESVMADVAKTLNVKTPVAKLMQQRGAEGFVNKPRTPQQICIARYVQQLRGMSSVDFDLILDDALTITQWIDSELISDKIGTIEHLFVDEYQDSGKLDHAIYARLPALNRFYVGDPDQAIYAFRGGRVENLLELCGGATELILLEQCYRCAPIICASAQRLVENNRNRYPKSLSSYRTYPGDVSFSSTPSESAEREAIAVWCRKVCNEWETSFNDVAILTRNNNAASEISSYLDQMRLPVRSRTAVRDENKLLRATIDVMPNKASDHVIYRWAQLKYGPEQAEKIRENSRRTQTPLVASIPDATLKHLFQPFDINDLLHNLIGLGFPKCQLETVQAIANRLPVFDLSQISFALQSPETRDTGTGITVSTIHGAKGLEFKHVWIAAVDQEVIPGRGDIEEERRLFYVALTRAKNEVVISTRESRRVQFNAKIPATIKPCTPSQFIAEMGLGI